jgi:glycosyltransferase involved in cell wall biosynthesis
MRIAYLGHGSDFKGGAEFCYVETVKALSLIGHEVYGIFNQKGVVDNALGGQLKCNLYLPYLRQWVSYPFEKKIKNYINYTKYWVANLKGHYNAVQSICHFLRENKIELAITNTQVTPALAFAAKKVNIPHVWYIHEFGELDHNFLYDFGKRTTFHQIDKHSEVIAYNSQIVKDYLIEKKISSQKLYRAYCVVDIQQNNPFLPTTNSMTFAFLGRPSPSKGQHIAVKALAQVIKSYPQANIKIIGVGEDAYSQELRQIAKELQLNNNIEFISFRLDPLAELNHCLALLVCSKIEAFGRVTVEGMKLGIPIIAANTGASPEILENGKLGTLFNYPDDKDLAKKMIEVLQNPANVLQKAKQAQVVANKKYSYEAHTEQWKQIIQLAVKKQ